MSSEQRLTEQSNPFLSSNLQQDDYSMVKNNNQNAISSQKCIPRPNSGDTLIFNYNTEKNFIKNRNSVQNADSLRKVVQYATPADRIGVFSMGRNSKVDTRP